MNKTKEKVYSITCFTLMLDQLIKAIVKSNLTLNEEIIVIKNFFSILYVKNKGAAFSILSNQTFLLIIISIFIIFILDRFITKEKNLNKVTLISIGFILGGIFGNLIDRILSKGVIDYLSFTIFNYSFPIFNLADIAITLGVLVLIINILKEELKSKKKK